MVFYTSKFSEELSEWKRVETDQTNVTIDAEAPIKEHSIRIQAVNQNGPGLISEVINATSDEHCALKILSFWWNSTISDEPLKIDVVTDNKSGWELEPEAEIVLRCSGTVEKLEYAFYEK